MRIGGEISPRKAEGGGIDRKLFISDFLILIKGEKMSTQVNQISVKDVLDFLRDYLETEIENEGRKIIEPIQCDYDKENDEAYCTVVTERKQKRDWLEAEDPEILPDGTRDWRSIDDSTEYGTVTIRYVAHPKGTEINVSLTPRLHIVNAELVFTTKKLTFTVKITQGYLESAEIKYYSSDEFESFGKGNYKTEFEVLINPDLTIKYEKSFVHLLSPPVYQTMKTEYKISQADPEGWEEKYLQNLRWVQKWLEKNITVDEAKEMLTELLEFYEPEEVDSPENGFVKGLINFIKEEIINSDKAEVTIE